jgi:hypothetical protein
MGKLRKKYQLYFELCDVESTQKAGFIRQNLQNFGVHNGVLLFKNDVASTNDDIDMLGCDLIQKQWILWRIKIWKGFGRQEIWASKEIQGEQEGTEK